MSIYESSKTSKFTFCISLQIQIVRQVELNTFAWKNLEVKFSMKFGRIVAYKNTQVFSHDMQKTNCSRRVFYESPEHEDR